MIPFSICLYLSYFTWHNTSKVHSYCHSGRISFFLMAGYYCVCVCVCARIYHFFWRLFLFKNGQLDHQWEWSRTLVGRCEAEDCCFLLWSLWVSQVVLVVKNLSANAGDTRVVGLIPGLGWSPGVGNGNPLHYSCLKNSIDRGAWWATVHGVTKSWTRLSTCACTHTPILLLMD